MASYISLRQLRDSVRNRCYMNNSEFISDTELNEYIGDSWDELYDILIQKYEEDYFIKSTDITLASGTASYDLPVDFYKSRGVDLKISDTDWTPLQRYRFTERTRASQLLALISNIKYKVQGDKIYFTPEPTSTDTVKLWYIPNPRRLYDVTCSAITAGADTIFKVAWYLGTSDSTAENPAFQAGDYIRTQGFTGGEWNGLFKVKSIAFSINGTCDLTVETDTSSYTAASVLGTVSSAVNVQSGWDSYVVADASIKCLQKEESDTAPLVQVKADLLRRILSSASQRDAGEPMTVTDVQDYENLYAY